MPPPCPSAEGRNYVLRPGNRFLPWGERPTEDGQTILDEGNELRVGRRLAIGFGLAPGRAELRANTQFEPKKVPYPSLRDCIRGQTH